VSVRPRSIAIALLAALWSLVAMAQTVTTCDGACTVTLVVSIDTPVLNLDAAAGASIAGAILAVWAAGWAFRSLIRFLKTSDGETSTEET
jgi:hypothetical protein